MDDSKESDPADCCNSGCNPCILDAREKSKKINSQIKSINCISPIKYTQFSVTCIETSGRFLLFTFKLENYNKNNQNCSVNYEAGQYFILKAPHESDKGDHFTRPYTPLKSPNNISILNIKGKQAELAKTEFQILTKTYDNGLMSNYLSELKIGDVTLWRGPYGSYKYCPNDYHNILLICQGVAITTMFSVINEVLCNEDDNTKLFLIYCCKNMQSVMFRENLYDLRLNWNFQYNIFLSESIEVSLKYKEPIINRKVFVEDLDNYIRNNEDIGVLICGSDSFMKFFKDAILNFNINEKNITVF